MQLAFSVQPVEAGLVSVAMAADGSVGLARKAPDWDLFRGVGEARPPVCAVPQPPETAGGGARSAPAARQLLLALTLPEIGL
jgi:hypothetical protein